MAMSDVAALMDLCTGNWKQQAVRAVTKLGVMDVPGLSLDTPTPMSTLAQHTHCNQEYLYRLLRYVSQFGLLIEEPGQQFRLTPMGQLLQADNPTGLRYAAIHFGEPGHYLPWQYLCTAVKEGTSAFQYFEDCPVFDYLSRPENSEQMDTFNRLMTAKDKTMESAAKLHDFSGYRKVVDLGGGHGQLLMDILDIYPSVEEGVVVEIPAVVDDALPPKDSCKGKITWIKGDLFKEVPVQADCYVMKNVLHDWDNSSCTTILRNLRTVMPEGSTFVLFDSIMPPFGSQGFHPAKSMDINMMAMCNGKERTLQQWEELMGTAGFTITDVKDALSMSAIVAVPSTST